MAHEKSSAFVIDPVYSAVCKKPSTNEDGEEENIEWLYGEAECESYRLAVLRDRCEAAQLKVWYPGAYHRPFSACLFRCRLEDLGLGNHGLAMRSNANHISARVNERLIFESSAVDAASSTVHHIPSCDVVTQDLKSKDQQFLILDLKIWKESQLEGCPEPPCVAIHNPGTRKVMSQEEEVRWEWSADGSEWSRCRALVSAKGHLCSHLTEDPSQIVYCKRVFEQENVLIFDFGQELLGRIHVVRESNSTEGAAKLSVGLGESIEEAMNTNPEHLEQCTNMVCAAASNQNEEKGTTWQSEHLVAFRYVCFPHNSIAEASASASKHKDDGDYLQQLVFCEASFHSAQYQGAFAASDSVLTQIWMKAAYTLRLCMHHGFLVDGIKRDRLPWTGDLAVSLMANAYTFGDSDIVANSLTVLGRAGISKNQDVNGILDYSLWWIVCQDLFQLYFHEKSHLEREWSRIKDAFHCLIGRDPKGDQDPFLFVYDNAWVFIDWVEMEGKTTALQILWWWALHCGIALALRMKDPTMATWLEKRKLSLEEKLLSCGCWDSQAGLWRSSPDSQTHCRHANLLAVVSGLTLPENASYIAHALMGIKLTPVGTPYMKFFECLALSLLGHEVDSLRNMRSYWEGMLEKGATTFWEAFDEKDLNVTAFYDRPFGKSLCHAWGAGPCQFFPQVILGIRPLSDGWNEWTCHSKLLDGSLLNWVDITVPTPHGCIEIKASLEATRIKVPSGTTLKLDRISYPGPTDVVFSFAKDGECFQIDPKTLKEWSAPYRNWHYHPDHVIPPKPEIRGFEGVTMTDVPTVYQLPGNSKTWYMSFIGYDGVGYQSFVAESIDLLYWTNMRVSMDFGEEGEFDFGGRVLGAYLYQSYDIKASRILERRNGLFWSLYGAYAKRGGYEIDPGYEGVATSKDGLHWQREKDEPILSVYDSDCESWEESSIYQPWLVKHDEKFYNFYNAKRMPEWIEQIGLSESSDLLEWRRYPANPVLRVRKGGFDDTFCADGKVFRDGDHWVMFYFGVNEEGAHIMIAFSRDLRQWTADPEPLYRANGNPSGLDKQHAHKISLIWNPVNEAWYMFYCAVGNQGRGIGLITSRPLW